MFDTSHVRIMLADVTVEMKIGIHPWEKHPERPQRVKVNVDLYTKDPSYLFKAADGTAPIIDYDPVRSAIKDWPARPHVLYLEECVKELLALGFADERVEACRVAMTKPDIFIETRAAGIEIFISRADYLAQLESA